MWVKILLHPVWDVLIFCFSNKRIQEALDSFLSPHWNTIWSWDLRTIKYWQSSEACVKEAKFQVSFLGQENVHRIKGYGPRTYRSRDWVIRAIDVDIVFHFASRSWWPESVINLYVFRTQIYTLETRSRKCPWKVGGVSWIWDRIAVIALKIIMF